MWLKFNLTPNKTWDNPNIQICFNGKINGSSILEYNWNILEITEVFANNLKAILNSEQICGYFEWSDKSILRWKFDDCHSFAFNLVTWSSFLYPGLPEDEEFKKFWLEYIWDYNELTAKNELKQWDLLTSWTVYHNHSHSFVYLWNIWNEDLFINCRGFNGYTDINWAWFKEFTDEVLDEFFVKIKWVIHIREGLRKWWSLAINTINEILCSYYNMGKYMFTEK